MLPADTVRAGWDINSCLAAFDQAGQIVHSILRFSRMLKKLLFSPARPLRAETRHSPCGVLAPLRGSTYRRDSRRSKR